MVCCCLKNFQIHLRDGIFSDAHFDSFNYFLYNGKLIFSVDDVLGRFSTFEQPLKIGNIRFYNGNGGYSLNQAQLNFCNSRFDAPYGFSKYQFHGFIIDGQYNLLGSPYLFPSNLESFENTSIKNYLSSLKFFTGFWYNSVLYTCEIVVVLEDIPFKQLFNFRDFIRGGDGKV